MKPIQVYLPEAFIKQLKQKALDDGSSVSDLIRDALGADDVLLTNKIVVPKVKSLNHEIMKKKNIHTVQKQPQVINNLPTAMPTTLEEANDPGSPGYSAKITPDVIKTPTEAVNKVKALPKKEPWSGPISKQYSSRKKGKERHIEL